MGFGIFEIEEQLKNKLNKKIDLITYKSLSPHLKEEILKDESKYYENRHPIHRTYFRQRRCY
jgi:predicted nucleotidyltransferase